MSFEWTAKFSGNYIAITAINNYLLNLIIPLHVLPADPSMNQFNSWFDSITSQVNHAVNQASQAFSAPATDVSEQQAEAKADDADIETSEQQHAEQQRRGSQPTPVLENAAQMGGLSALCVLNSKL